MLPSGALITCSNSNKAMVDADFTHDACATHDECLLMFIVEQHSVGINRCSRPLSAVTFFLADITGHGIHVETIHKTASYIATLAKEKQATVAGKMHEHLVTICEKTERHGYGVHSHWIR